MANFFITGGTGFVGSHLIKRLRYPENKLFCLIRNQGSRPVEDDSIKWIEADLFDIKSYQQFLEQADYVFHLAGLLSARRKEDYIKTNVYGTEALLKACHEIGAPKRRFVYMSSIAAMGANHQGKLLKESDSCRPRTEYGKSKREAELTAINYSNSIPVTILRPSFVYGRGDMRGLKFLYSLFTQPAPVWASAIKTISLCHVSDVIRSCLLSIKKGLQSGEIFIISDPETYTWKKIMTTLEEIFNKFLTTAYNQDDVVFKRFFKRLEEFYLLLKETDECQYWGCDISKARKIFNFHPRISLKEGAQDIIQWYLEEGLLDFENIKESKIFQ
jgi:nucleoside-diphosphate-sugar epimerase